MKIRPLTHATQVGANAAWSPSVTEAFDFAAKAHGKQRYGTLPYSFHLRSVMDTLVQLGFDSEQHLIVGALHDVLEDTEVPRNALEGKFGSGVTQAAAQLARGRGEPIGTYLAGMSPLAFAVKLADRIGNITHLDFGTAAQVKWHREHLFPRYAAEMSAFRSVVARHGAAHGHAGAALEATFARARQVLFQHPQSDAPLTPREAPHVPHQANAVSKARRGWWQDDGSPPGTQPLVWLRRVADIATRAQRRPGLQPHDQLPVLYELAQRAGCDELQSLAARLAAASGAQVRHPPTAVKEERRARERVETNFGGDAAQLTDLLRCSLVFERLSALYDALPVIDGTCEVVLIKDRYAVPFADGYRDLLLNVRLPCGLVAEIQLHLAAVYDQLQGPVRRLYAETRQIFVRAQYEKRPLTGEELALVRAKNAESEQLLRTAYLGSGVRNAD